MLDQIEVQISVYDMWVTIGTYNVKHIPRIGERVSVSGNIEKGYFAGMVSGVRHDLDTGYFAGMVSGVRHDLDTGYIYVQLGN